MTEISQTDRYLGWDSADLMSLRNLIVTHTSTIDQMVCILTVSLLNVKGTWNELTLM